MAVYTLRSEMSRFSYVDSEESYEQALVKRYNDMSYGRLIEPMLKAPGSNMSIDSKKGWSVLGKVLDFMV